jgi:hypothetical protein
MYFLAPMLYVALAFSSFAQQYPAFEWNKKSTLDTDDRVEFPGVVLEPGIYVIRLRETGDRRSFVELLNQDETQVLATLVAVPDHRVRPDDSSDFTFYDIKRSGPRPIQSWFYTGDLVGLEFVYTKVRAKEIAAASGDHVMASNGNKNGVIVAITPSGKEVVIDEPPTQTARRKPQ